MTASPTEFKLARVVLFILIYYPVERVLYFEAVSVEVCSLLGRFVWIVL